MLVRSGKKEKETKANTVHGTLKKGQDKNTVAKNKNPFTNVASKGKR